MSHSIESRKRVPKIVAIGGAAATVLGVSLFAWLSVWLLTGPEGGVRLGNEMEPYALEYLREHRVLDPEEDVLAYYDVTVSLKGTEAAILTSDRMIYHKSDQTMSIPIREIEDVRHRYETLIGDVIEIQAASGQTMKVEIAPMNQGKTFKNVLMTAWEKSR